MLMLAYPAVALTAPEFVLESNNNFAHPHDLELDPSGQRLFVADTNNHIIKVLDANSLQQIAILGEGELNAPHDVHFDSTGRLLVADSGNNRVVVYRLDGEKLIQESVLSENINSPEGVTTSSRGDIFVASTGNHKILKFSQNRLVKEVGQRGDDQLEFIRPHDIEFGPDELLYVGDPGNRRIQVLTEALTFHSTIKSSDKPFKEPKYLALDKNRFLYIADQQNNLVRIFNAEHRQVESIAQAGKKALNYIEGIEVVGEKIWISDTYNDRVVLFNWSN